jgi:predicted CXXCH cytochrome family protein
MKRVYIKGYLLLLLVSGIVAFFSLKSFGREGSKKKVRKVLSEGDKSFSFDLKTIFKHRLNLDDYIGKKIIILKFGSIYCSSCIDAIPKLVKLQEKYKEDLQIVEVNLDIYGKLRAFRFYNGLKKILNYPVIIDDGLKISKKYGVTTLPTNVVIDKEGIIKYISRGYSELEEEKLEDTINSILGIKKIVIDEVREEKVKILMPKNVTKTFQNDIYVIGKVAVPGFKVTMTLNNGSKQEQITTKKMFYFRTPLAIGSNYIEIKSIVDGKIEDTKAIVIFRELKLIKIGEPVPFSEYKFHTKENEALCSECHELVPPASDESKMVLITDFCLKCHAELLSDEYVHGPISVGGCLPCHDFSSKPDRYELKSKGSSLCYICHADKKAELEKENLHGPVATGFCVLCHDPHSAPFKFQLQRWGGELCFFCHDALRRFQATSNQHPPFRDGECTRCHEPHSADSKQFFLKKEKVVDLCYSCHDKKGLAGHRHKVGIAPTQVELLPTMRTDENGLLICTTCHNPHGDNGQKLLPPGGCATCHRERGSE